MVIGVGRGDSSGGGGSSSSGGGSGGSGDCSGVGRLLDI